VKSRKQETATRALPSSRSMAQVVIQSLYSFTSFFFP
jgi:hypothetical protein